jgi:hypothetical protein
MAVPNMVKKNSTIRVDVQNPNLNQTALTTSFWHILFNKEFLPLPENTIAFQIYTLGRSPRLGHLAGPY